MANQPFLARILGIPHIPTVRQINVRSAPTVSSQLLFKADVGTSNLGILDVQPDAEGRELHGKVYQWFHIDFGSSRYGWARDDLIEVYGDGTSAGYGVINTPTMAFTLRRRDTIRPGQETFRPSQPGGVQPIGVRTPVTPSQPVQPVQPSRPATPSQPAQLTSVQPISVQPATIQPSAQPATVEVKDELPDRTGPAMAQCMGKTGLTVRSGPGTQHGQLARMQYLEIVPILDSADGQDGKAFKWAKVDYKGTVGWVRCDFIRLSGDFSKTGLAPIDLYPSPAPDSWWVRDFDMNGSLIGAIHHGWDHAGNIGAPINAGPYGGTVVRVATCSKCGANGASILDKGFQLGDPRVLNDPAWNFGYGHFIIVRYENDKLPESTKQYLTTQGASGGHVFVMYAHLSKMHVRVGDVVAPDARIGDLGNSGQSSGPHLHLEVRFSTNPNEEWARMRAGLRSPEILFLR